MKRVIILLAILSSFFLTIPFATGSNPISLQQHTSGSQDTRSPTIRALLIGIDEYQRVSNLRGCVNDVELMRTLLTGKFDVPQENIQTLTNSRASRHAILSTIQSHLIE